MTHPAYHIAKKELRDIWRERSILIAIAVQFFVAAFSAFLTVGLVGLYDPESIQDFPRQRVAYVGPGGFDTYLQDASNIALFHRDLDDAINGFRNGFFVAVVEEAEPNGTLGPRTVTLLVGEGEVETTLVVTQLKELLRAYERDLREERSGRIEQAVTYTDIDVRPGVLFGFAFGVLLPLLVAVPVFLSGAIAGDAMTQEINANTLPLLRATPASGWSIVLGKLAAPVLLTPLQVLIWVGLLALNGLPVSHTWALLLLATLASIIVTTTSLAIAIVVKREGASQAAYTLFLLAVSLLTLGLPVDPLNLIARLGVGRVDASVWTTLGAYAVAAAATLTAGAWFVGRRLSRLEG